MNCIGCRPPSPTRCRSWSRTSESDCSTAADTSRNLPPRNTGLIDGQDTLTLPTIRAKLSAQIARRCIGYLPAQWAEPHVKAGRLVVKRVGGREAGGEPCISPGIRARPAGPFLARLREPLTRAYLLGESGSP